MIQNGIALPVYYWYILGIELLVFITFAGMSALIYWRRSAHIGALLVAILFVSYGCVETTFTLILIYFDPYLWWQPRRALQALGEWMSFAILLLFPDGSFFPRWTRWPALIYALICLGWFVFPNMPFNVTNGYVFNLWNPWSYIFLIAVHCISFYAMAQRYRNLAEGPQRQQIKWAIFGLAITASASVIRYGLDPIRNVTGLFGDPASGFVFNILQRPLQWLFLCAAPIGMGIATLRYRLWDIDPIITRALTYLILSAALFATIVIGIPALNSFSAQRLSGPLQLGLSVAVGIVLLGVRGRLQASLDRRFNRRRIDARDSLRRFADQIGTMTDISQLQQVLPMQVAQIHQIERCVLLMRDQTHAYAVVGRYEAPDTPQLLTSEIATLQQGSAIQKPETSWPLVLPLLAPMPDGSQSLIAILALGPHRSARPYDIADLQDLQLLADRAASALAVSVLIDHERQRHPRQKIVDPYTPNHYLSAGSRLFVGRDADLLFLKEQLCRGSSVVLSGERRMGKTSLIQQIPAQIEADCIAIKLDGQRLAVVGGFSALCHELASELCYALEMQEPSFADFRERPDAQLLRQTLPAVIHRAAGRRLVLLIDEFEELEQRLRDQDFNRAALGLLRHLMQHQSQMALLLVSSNAPEDMTPDLWPALLNTTMHRRIGPLNTVAAQQLIRRPLDQGSYYSDEAVSLIEDLTGGHPYFIHMLGSVLIQHANQQGLPLIEHNLCGQALPEVLELASAHLSDLWNSSNPAEQYLLRRLSANGYGAQIQISQPLQQNDFSQEQCVAALHRLERRGLLSSEQGSYSWRLRLFCDWVERYS